MYHIVTWWMISRKCLPDGSWSSGPTRCLKRDNDTDSKHCQHEDVPVIQNGEYICGGGRHEAGKECALLCGSGYIPEKRSPGKITCEERNGTLSWHKSGGNRLIPCSARLMRDYFLRNCNRKFFLKTIYVCLLEGPRLVTGCIHIFNNQIFYWYIYFLSTPAFMIYIFTALFYHVFLLPQQFDMFCNNFIQSFLYLSLYAGTQAAINSIRISLDRILAITIFPSSECACNLILKRQNTDWSIDYYYLWKLHVTNWLPFMWISDDTCYLAECETTIDLELEQMPKISRFFTTVSTDATTDSMRPSAHSCDMGAVISVNVTKTGNVKIKYYFVW